MAEGPMESKLAGEFAPRSEAEWRVAAEKAARGKPLDKLRTRTEDGFDLEPLYLEDVRGLADERPGLAPFTRGETASGDRAFGWGIRQAFADADLDRSNSAILRDLERGVSQVLLAFDAPTQRGEDPDGQADAGVGGLPLASVDDLDLVLAGVLDDLAPIVLESTVAPLAQAALLIGLWRRRGRDLAQMQGSLGASPLSAWSKLGALPGGPEQALADVAALARWCAEHAPLVTVARADEGPSHEAGASDAEGLALVTAEAVAYLRAFEIAGHDPTAGAAQIELDLRIGADVFAGIAKLRAVRLLWSRVAEIIGLPSSARPTVVARLGRRGLTAKDPWVNILRGTAATFAAAVGGARAFSLEPFDSAVGEADELGRRMARNTQLILQEESHLGRVLDPAGGSWYLEHRSEALAAAAFTALQRIEAEGGLVQSLRSGAAQARVDAEAKARRRRVRTRRHPLTGVTEFPDVNEAPLTRAQPDSTEVARAAEARLELCRARGRPEPISEARASAAIDAARDGATLGGLQAALHPDGEAEAIQVFAPARLAEPFEVLRTTVEASAPGTVFLANIGPVARHTARATFVQNLVAVGGFPVHHGPPSEAAATTVAAWREAGKAPVTIVCGADQDYQAHAEDFVRALTAAGTKVWLAGRPGDLEAPLQAAGLEGHIALGQDVLTTLETFCAVFGLGAARGADR